MKIFFIRAVALFSLIISLISVPLQTVAAANLVTNGNFEAPIVTASDKWDIFPSGTSDLGWTVEWQPGDASTYNGYSRPNTASLEIQKNGHLGYQAAEGQQWAELDSDWFGPTGPIMSEPASVRIYQDISTTPGNQYELNFDFSPRPDAADASQNVLKVKWNNSTVDTISKSNSSGTHNEWDSYSHTVTATGDTTRLEFADEGMPNSVGTYLDNVSLLDLGASTPTDPGNGNGTSTATTTPPAATSTDPIDNGGGTGGDNDGGNGTSTDNGGNSNGGDSSNSSDSSSNPHRSHSSSGSHRHSVGGQVLGASVGPLTCSINGTTYAAFGGDSTTYNWQTPAGFTISSTGTSSIDGSFDATSTGPIIVTSGGFSSVCLSGAVLGDSTSTLPAMPYTGANGNIYLTYILSYLGVLVVSEAFISHFRKHSKKTE